MLGMAVVISLFGIVNTLALSVFEGRGVLDGLAEGFRVVRDRNLDAAERIVHEVCLSRAGLVVGIDQSSNPLMNSGSSVSKASRSSPAGGS
jgi:hypothetical protein